MSTNPNPVRKACSVCESTKAELRPYGVGGAPICFDCMKARPERENEAKRQFDAATRATKASMVVIGSETGPRAATYEEAVMVEDFIQDAERLIEKVRP